MSRHRFFLNDQLSDGAGTVPLSLSASDVHHAVDVLRILPGEEIVVVEPYGGAYIVEVAATEAGGVSGRVVGELPVAFEPHITLVQGIAKGSTMDDIVQHAVELGAERIVPLNTQRTVVRLDAQKAAKRTQRWQRIAEGAARQSQRARIPTVAEPLSLQALLSELSGYDAVVVLWEESDAGSLHSTFADAGISPEHPEARVALVVGPEGGLTAEEVSVLVGAGAKVATLGPAVLRAETAALAATTLAAHALGAMEHMGHERGDLDDQTDGRERPEQGGRA